jgi:flavin-dependent dehydrogenase
MFDALVIGAGPAGATAARLLAAGGWRVALVETSEIPRR